MPDRGLVAVDARPGTGRPHRGCFAPAVRGHPAAVSTPGSSLLRASVLGAATGGRTTAGVTALALTAGPDAPSGALGRPAAKVLVPLLALGELVGDKLPATPSRTEPAGLVGRAAAAALCGWTTAGRTHDAPAVPVVAAAGAALATSYAGAAYRGWCARRGWPDWPAAVLEDVIAFGAAAWAARPVPRQQLPPPPGPGGAILEPAG